MDPIQTPIQQPPQTPPEIIIPQPKPNYLKTIIFSVLVIITLSLISYLIFQNQKLQKIVLNPQVSPTIQASSPTPKTVSSISIPPDETAEWKTLIGNSFMYSNSVYSGYSIKYPPSCTLKTGGILICKITHGNVTLIVNAGGHGLPFNTTILKNSEPKIIPAGEGTFFEIELKDSNTVLGVVNINKTKLLTQEPVFMFEFRDLPIDDVAEFEKLFDQILSTFKFTN